MELDPPHSLENPNWLYDFERGIWILLPKPYDELKWYQKWWYIFVQPELDNE